MSNISPTTIPEVSTLVELVRWRAEVQPEQRLYTFLQDGVGTEATLTYEGLDLQAQRIASMLQRIDASGKRALLLYPPGLDYIIAFFGCLYAGVIAVPAYLPRLNRTDARLQTVVTDTQAAIVLTTQQFYSNIEQRLGEMPALAALHWLITDQNVDSRQQSWQESNVHHDTLAFLQYTSGSTSTPKGVMLSHGNLLHNLSQIHSCFEHTSQSCGVIWLPPYHDMGLIGGILQPLYGGFPVTLMAPLTFLQRPLGWLQTISHIRATTSGGPNFAYELCIQKTTPEERKDLDLSSWEVAFTGAEPIRYETLKRFAQTFAPCGFRPEAFYPCYGLAEATLLVSSSKKQAQPTIRIFLNSALEHNQIVVATSEHKAGDVRQLVGCGQHIAGQQIVIADPELLSSCPPGRVGEIWVAGPSIAQGYWGRQVDTDITFHAYLADTGAGPFLRTGDLGVLLDGELFVTGRIKDLIIIHGRNHYPQDIEQTVQQSHSALRPGCGAAFTITINDEERLAIVHEVDRQYRRLSVADRRAVIGAIRQAVVEQHELQPYTIVLIKPGSIPKTSSGKIQRYVCRNIFLESQLEILDSEIIDSSTTVDAQETLSPELVLAAQDDKRPQLLVSYLRQLVAGVRQIDPARVEPRQPLSMIGLDSIMAIQLQHKLEMHLGIVLPMAMFLQQQSIDQLAASILPQLSESLCGPEAIRALATERLDKYRLSRGQQALWFLNRLAPESLAYNIVSVVRIRGDLDITKAHQAFQLLVDRHAVLRTTFALEGGELVQRVYERGEVCFHQIDVSSLDEAELKNRLAEEAYQPFDLEHGPLLRVHLFAQSPQDHYLLLAVHHIVCDFWSLAVFMHEFGIVYNSFQADREASLAPLALEYTDYVRWEGDLLASPEGERQREYWRQQLSGQLPVLQLPSARPRPPVQTYRGAAHPFILDKELTSRLQILSEQQAATLFMTLLAAFQILLFRHTGQEDILVGVPTAGRPRSQLANLVGYFVNPIVLRADFSTKQTCTEFLAQVRRTVLEALEHQEYPFALLVEQLQPHHDPSYSPLFQTMFNFQKSPLVGEASLASMALGEAGACLSIGGLDIESVALEQRATQFDLTLVMAEADDKLVASFLYNADLFDADQIARMAGHFQTLLAEIATDPGRQITRLPLLTQAEQQQLLSIENDILLNYPVDVCLHQLFEDQVVRTPDASAVVFQGAHLTYRELNQRANQLAHYLQERGISSDVGVGICIDRSLEMVIGLLGILKAGGAYVPIDPTYPAERIAFMLKDAQMPLLLTQQRQAHRLRDYAPQIVCLDSDWATIAKHSTQNLGAEVMAAHLAYVIYTSGSTGKPKGVMIPHRNVVNFFYAMDQRIGCTDMDTLLAVTSISFDISVLELFWTLTRGARVVILGEQTTSITTQQAEQPQQAKSIEFSLFYFASDDSAPERDKYRLLLEGAKFADTHGFTAIWTPERHFHSFGGLYPNPAITSAALATLTKHLQIRGGSVVMPLHNPIRVAEEWSVVDNLSNGRAGIAFASGWHANDFVFFPENYPNRRELTLEGIETVQKLWRGASIPMRGGAGNEIAIQLYPQPVQPELPIWLTAAGNPDTFVAAGKLGFNILTHLLGQSLDDLAAKIKLYRQALAQHGYDPQAGHVTLMLHTFIGEDRDVVRKTVIGPFTNYLRSSVDLIHNLIRSLNLPLDLNSMSAQDMEDLLSFAFDRYFETSALFGTPDTSLALIERLKAIGVDEIACLIDFGVDVDSTLAGLEQLAQLRELANQSHIHPQMSLAEAAITYNASLLQCTPSMMRMQSLSPQTLESLQSLRALLLGGEALPVSLARNVQNALPGRIINMYGPTETTIWSTTYELDQFGEGESVPIGWPIANTDVYILDQLFQPVPTGVTGQLYIGGAGLARGYLDQPELTAEKFVPHPFSHAIGARLYKTGDLARYRPNGTIEFLGRVDHQMKLRGFRIELEEIEAVLHQHPDVRDAVVLARKDRPDDTRLVAYVVPHQASNAKQQASQDLVQHGSGRLTLSASELRSFLRDRLPNYMVPSAFIVLEVLPLTPNSKVDRHALAALDKAHLSTQSTYEAPRSKLEQMIAQIWQQTLKCEKVGIHDNFFDIGGHSLLLAQVHSQLQERLQRELALIKLLEYPTISLLARYLEKGHNEQSSIKQSQDRASKQLEGLRRRRKRANEGNKQL
jgi:natural product biosynthesis luciferase-like monooxygenase protein